MRRSVTHWSISLCRSWSDRCGSINFTSYWFSCWSLKWYWSLCLWRSGVRRCICWCIRSSLLRGIWWDNGCICAWNLVGLGRRRCLIRKSYLLKRLIAILLLWLLSWLSSICNWLFSYRITLITIWNSCLLSFISRNEVNTASNIFRVLIHTNSCFRFILLIEIKVIVAIWATKIVATVTIIVIICFLNRLWLCVYRNIVISKGAISNTVVVITKNSLIWICRSSIYKLWILDRSLSLLLLLLLLLYLLLWLRRCWRLFAYNRLNIRLWKTIILFSSLLINNLIKNK